VQGMLEVLGIPYTGSGVLASALAMDKVMSKCVLTAKGVRMPGDVFLGSLGDPRVAELEAVPFPVIVKPNAQGSSFGLTVVQERESLKAALDTAFQYDDAVLVEQYIKGIEISVPVIGNESLEALPVVEIIPAGGIYDYAAKYTPGATEEIIPARLSPELTKQAQEIACTCHRVLGCRGMSRTDMIVTDDGGIYTLEVNTIPGMTPTSLLPQSARAAGIPFPDLLDRLISLALEGRNNRA
jgi:D-alanine-D-alanine ligase